jgi:dynein heavy chain
LNKTDPKKYPGVKLEIVNPKSVTMDELFGWVDLKTVEWNDGVLSTMMSRLCMEEGNDQ